MTTGQQAGSRSAGPGDQVHEHQRQEQLRRLLRMRRAAEDLATARFLERRAQQAASPVLASLLRERAGERRSRGERLLGGPPDPRPARPPRPGT